MKKCYNCEIQDFLFEIKGTVRIDKLENIIDEELIYYCIDELKKNWNHNSNGLKTI